MRFTPREDKLYQNYFVVLLSSPRFFESVGRNILIVAANSLLPQSVLSWDASSDVPSQYLLLYSCFTILVTLIPFFSCIVCKSVFFYQRPDLSWTFGAILYLHFWILAPTLWICQMLVLMLQPPWDCQPQHFPAEVRHIFLERQAGGRQSLLLQARKLLLEMHLKKIFSMKSIFDPRAKSPVAAIKARAGTRWII